ncbi:MAG: Gfo/Idh/MocA family oxidoreductase [Armatimonadia bacterium]
MKVAIIGLGNIAGTHIAQWQKIEGAQIVAGSDISAENVAKAEASCGLKGYSDWKVMLDEQQPDMVSICTPPFLHREMAVECLQRGIHVLCEKPMAATLEDAEALAEAAKTAKAILMIAYCHRFHGPMMKAKEVLDSGIIGKPIFFRGGFTGMIKFATNHRANLKMAGGGSLMDNGSHAADLYQFLLGKFKSVSCRAGTFMQDMETDDVGIILFTGENGCYGEVIAGYSLPGEFTQWIITGEKGILSVDNYFSGPVRVRMHDSQEWQEFEADNSETRFDREFKHFVECAKEGKQPISNAETALHIQRVITKAYEAAKSEGLAV